MGQWTNNNNMGRGPTTKHTICPQPFIYDENTSCNQLQPVFEQVLNISKMRQPATTLTQNEGNCNQKKDWTKVQSSLVIWLSFVL